jgi:hypothetical protein
MFIALLVCVGSVVGSSLAVANESETPSFTIIFDRFGTVDRSGMVTITGTYSCAIPSGSYYDQSEIGMYLVDARGVEEYAYLIDGLDCDGQAHTFMMESKPWLSEFRPGRLSYAAWGFVGWYDDSATWDATGWLGEGALILRPR